MDRVPTGIRGFDAMLNGGFLPQTANLVEGAPGTGKSTLGLQFVYTGITQYDEPGVILTFEEFPQQYYQSAASFGWDLRELERVDKLRVVMTSPEVTYADWQQVDGRIKEMAHLIGARRILVDSLSHFERITPDPDDLRLLIHSFVNAVKREGLTAIFTLESPVLLGDAVTRTGQGELAYVVDSYTLLRFVEIDSTVHRALLVLKLRGSDHAKDIRELEITDQGFEVQRKFEGQQGLMSGNPRRMAESFVEAFVRR